MKNQSTRRYVRSIALWLLVFTFLRFALPAMPYDWDIFIGFRYVLAAFSQTLFHSDWLLWDLILFFCAVCTTLVIPAPEGSSLRKRILLPILTTVAVFAVTTPLINPAIDAAYHAYDDYQDALHQKRLDATYGEIRDFLQDADVGYAYNTNVQRHDPEFLELFPELASTHPYTDGRGGHYTGYHATDVILLDYDTHRVGIVYFRYGDPAFYLYALQPVDRITGQIRQQVTYLPSPGGTFISYSYSYDLEQYTDALVLTMEGGQLYAVTGLSKEDDLLFLGLNSSTELLNHWSEQND